MLIKSNSAVLRRENTRPKIKNTFFQDLKKYRVLILMLIPAIAYYIIFNYIPMGGSVLAFKNFNYRDGILGSPWVGFKNFTFFFQSGVAFKVTRNTILYNASFLIVDTVLQLTVAIIIAELVNKYFKKVVQSFLFFPYFVSWVIVGAFIYNIFNFEHGMLNSILEAVGISPVNAYSTPGMWKYILLFFRAWKNVGYGSVVYLAAITGIDSEIYEAAKIDGANIMQRIKNITIPCLIPTVIILTLLAVGTIFVGDFSMFYQIVGDNGMLFDATDVIDTFVFRSLLRSQEVGMAAAIGLYQSVLCFTFVMVTNFLVKKVDPDSALF